MADFSKFGISPGTILDVKDTNGRIMSEQLVRDTVGWTGKNLFKYKNNVISGYTYTVNHITFEINDDLSVSLSGISTDNAALELISNITPPAGKYIISKQLAGETANNVYLQFNKYQGSTYKGALASIRDIISQEINIDYDGYDHLGLYVVVAGANVNVNGAKIYPMLRPSTMPDNTYEPYHDDVETELVDMYKIMGEMGAKNKLNYSSILIVPNADTGTITDNGENGISVNVTKAAGHWTDIKYYGNIKLKAGVTYKLSCIGVPSNVKGIRLHDGNSYIFNMADGATSATFTPENDVTITSWQTTIAVEGAGTHTFTYYPMLYEYNDIDTTYQRPNVYTNASLSDMFFWGLNIKKIELPANGTKTIVCSKHYQALFLFGQRGVSFMLWNENNAARLVKISDSSSSDSNTPTVTVSSDNHVVLHNSISDAEINFCVLAYEPFTIE